MAILLTMLAMIVLIVTVSLILISLTYKKASSGEALIRTGFGGPKVSLNGIMAIPVLHKCEIMDLTPQQIIQSYAIKDKEMNELTLEVTLFTRVNSMNYHELLMVAQKFGVDSASDSKFLTNHFSKKIEETVQAVAGRYTTAEFALNPLEVKESVITLFGMEYEGFIVEDLIIKVGVVHLDEPHQLTFA